MIKEYNHCGASIYHVGNKTFSINLLEDKIVKELLFQKVQDSVLSNF